MSSLGDLKTKELGRRGSNRNGVDYEESITRLEKTYPGLLAVRRILREVASRTKRFLEASLQVGRADSPCFAALCNYLFPVTLARAMTTRMVSERLRRRRLEEFQRRRDGHAAKAGQIDVHDGYSLIFDEKVIDYALMRCKSDLLRVAMNSTSVVASRARKDQAKLVELLEHSGRSHSGNRRRRQRRRHDSRRKYRRGNQWQGGRQAVNNSDFAICEFQHLERLLLVWGRQNYRRLAVSSATCFTKTSSTRARVFIWHILCVEFAKVLPRVWGPVLQHHLYWYSHHHVYYIRLRHTGDHCDADTAGLPPGHEESMPDAENILDVANCWTLHCRRHRVSAAYMPRKHCRRLCERLQRHTWTLGSRRLLLHPRCPRH